VKGFFGNAWELLQPDGEIHISHKTGYPYDAWDIEQLAWESSLTLIGKVSFQKRDYPGYNQKRGDGAYPNRGFPIGDCYTFKFCMKPNEVQEKYSLPYFDYLSSG
jgi:25S rRNA (uracil2634-N3)-methyltransferase